MGGGLRRIPQIAVVVQFVALLRCLGEYFRLKYFQPASFSVTRIEPFMLGALASAVFALAGILFYFGENYKTTVAAAMLNIAILFILRFTLL